MFRFPDFLYAITLGRLVVLSLVSALLLLTDQPRRQVPSVWISPLTPSGLGTFCIERRKDLTLRYVSAPLHRGGIEILPVPYSEVLGLPVQRVDQIAVRFQQKANRPILAAINGGFFDIPTGLPIGFLLRDGQMEFFNMPQGYRRSMVGFASGNGGKRSEIVISTPELMPKAYLEVVQGKEMRRQKLGLHVINVPGGKNSFGIFTTAYAAPVKLRPEGFYYLGKPMPQRPGWFELSEKLDRKAMRVPANHIIIGLNGSSRKLVNTVRLGAHVRPSWSLPAEWSSKRVNHGLLAGPRLLANGRVHVTAHEERLATSASPDRVVLAVKPSGEALLMWLHRDSRKNLPFEEVAALLKGLGATEAIALDGGRSRAILAQPHLYSTPSYFEGGRPVSNALVLALSAKG